MLHHHHHMLCLALLLCGVAYSNDNPVYIHDADELIEFSIKKNNESNYASTTVYLEDDIDFAGRTMEPIGNHSERYFLGTFDGQGHTISNLKMNVTTSEFAGLFGHSRGLTIKDVVMDESCSIMNSHMHSDCAYIGGVIGQCQSIDGPCIIENIVNMARVSFSGNIHKDLHLGGIVGVGWASNNHNAITRNCVNFGDVVHEGTVGGYCDIGGVVGHFINRLKYVQNSINYGTIRHNGTTPGDKYIGGIVGYMSLSGTENERSFVENCLSAGEVMSNSETLCFKGSIVGFANSTTNVTHCFWTNATGCNTPYNTNDTNAVTTNSSRAELDADLLRDMIEYAKQNTNTSNSSSFSEYHVLHLNGGRINSIAQETLAVTQSRFPTPLKEGTAFLFWCGDISCNATYNASDSSTSGMVDVYAIWNTSTVTFDFMNGSDSSSSFVKSTFQFNTSITYPEDVVREGYMHSGWEPAYSLMPGTDVTLYAQWTPNNYTVTLDVNGGNKLSISTMTVTFNTTYGNLPEASREGHTFIGWFNAKDATNERITNETTVTVANNHTLYAQWKEIPMSQVEIVFGTKDLTEEEIKNIIKQYTDDEFTILKLDTSEPDEVRVIIAFADAEIAEEFVRNVQEGREMIISHIKTIGYNTDNFNSFSVTRCIFTSLRLFSLL